MGFDIDRLRSCLSRSDSDSGADGDIRTDGGSEAPTGGGTFARLKHSDAVQALPFWLPPALLMGLFVYGAVGWNLLISFTDWSGLQQPEYTDLNLEMYTQMVSDASFIAAFRNTIVLLVVFTVISLAAGLVLAILVDQNIRFENTFRGSQLTLTRFEESLNTRRAND